MSSSAFGTLAPELAKLVVQSAAVRLREASFGPAQQVVLRGLLGESIRVLLDEMTRSGELAADEDYLSSLRTRLVNYLSVPEVAEALVSLAIDSRTLPMARLRELYEERGYDPDAFPVTFERAMDGCAMYLVRRVKEEASKDGSPLNNLVEVSKLYMLEETLREVVRRTEPTGPTADELERESWARCKRRWTLLGVPSEEAEALARNPTVGAPGPEVRVRLGQPVVVIAAEAGSGKSLLLDRLMQRAIARYRAREGGPLPVFLEATEVEGGKLREAIVKTSSGLGKSLADSGAAVFLDGLEEAGRAKARRLLDEAHYLPDRWPNTTVVVAGRPMQELEEERDRDEAVELPELTEDETEALIRKLSGEKTVFEVFSHGWPGSVREAVKRPLFASLVGLDMRNRFGPEPRSIGQLLAHLVERALRKADDVVELKELRDLAVAVTDSGAGRIRASDAGTRAEVGRLRATGLVRETGGVLRFSLQILSEWFAAQALELGEVDGEALASDFARLERWRYPLVMAVGNFGHERVMRIFEPVVRAAPAFASQVVDAAFAARAGGTEEGVGEDVEEVARRFRRTMAAWVDGLGPLTSFFGPVRGDGSLGTLAISGGEGGGSYIWYTGRVELPDVVSFSRVAETELRFGDWRRLWQRSYGTERQAAWAWRYTFKDLRHELQETLTDRKLPARTHMLAREAAWRTAKDLLFRLRRRTRSERPIDLGEVEACLDEVNAWEGDWITMVPPGAGGGSIRRFYEVRHLVEEVRRLRAAGETEMASPVPIYDLPFEEVRQRIGEGEPIYIWDPYSDERLLERAQIVVEEALRGYTEIVETLFPKLAPHMPMAATLPVRMVGHLEVGRGARRMPDVSCSLEPLPFGAESLVEIQLGGRLSWDEYGSYLRRRIYAVRPEVAGWLTPIFRYVHAGPLLDLTPITRTIYSWLWDDLRYARWIDKPNPWEI